MWVSEWVSEGAQSCPTLCDPVDCSPPGSPVHGILQAGILEWVAISFSRGSSRPKDRTQVSRIAGRLFNLWATRGFCHTTMQISCNYTHIPSLQSLTPFLPSHPSSLSQTARLGSPCHTATSHQLSILHLIVYIHWCYFLHLSHSLPPLRSTDISKKYGRYSRSPPPAGRWVAQPC